MGVLVLQRKLGGLNVGLQNVTGKMNDKNMRVRSIQVLL